MRFRHRTGRVRPVVDPDKAREAMLRNLYCITFNKNWEGAAWWPVQDQRGDHNSPSKYIASNFVQLRLAASLCFASLSRRCVLGLRRFRLGRGENKITGIILTLMNVQICLHRYTLSRSFHPFPSVCDLLLMTHKHNTKSW